MRFEIESMQNFHFRSICLLILLISFTSLSSQTVEKIIQNYILIDTDQGLGKIGDSIQIIRQSEGKTVEIGTAQIVRFHDGKTAAEASLEDISRIQIGDRVQKNPDAPEELQIPVLRIVQDMVLLDGGLSLQKNTPLEVYRLTNDGYQKIGMLSFVMLRESKMVGKIMETLPGQEIKPGDRVIIQTDEKPSKPFDPDLDIDKYFFQNFKLE